MDIYIFYCKGIYTFSVFICGASYRKPCPVNPTIVSVLPGRPLHNSLAALSGYYCIDEDIHELIIQLGDGRADAAIRSTYWVEDEDFWGVAAVDGNGALKSAPAPFSPAVSVGPTYFEVWVSQGTADAKQIRDVYVSFSAMDEDTIGKLLIEVTGSE